MIVESDNHCNDHGTIVLFIKNMNAVDAIVSSIHQKAIIISPTIGG